MSFYRTDQVASSVLVIDNDPLMLTAIGSVLDMQGHRCVLARNEVMALDSITKHQFDVIVLSIDQLQRGCDFAAKLRSAEGQADGRQAVNRDVPIVFLVPELSSTWQPKLAACGGVFSLLQPVDPYSLIDLVEKALWMPHLAKGRNEAPAAHLSMQKDWVKLSD